MPRKCLYYTPKISRFLVSVLYHEAQSLRMPMTELTEALLTQNLEGSESWRAAEASLLRGNSLAYPPAKANKRQSAAISSQGGPSSTPAAGSLSPSCAATHASHAPSTPARHSKGATLQRLSGNKKSPTLKEFPHVPTYARVTGSHFPAKKQIPGNIT